MTRVGFNARRVLVTGGSGFLGRWVCEALAAEGGAEVTAPRSAQHDLRDADAVERLFARTRPDVVIHLAAVVGGIGANRKSPGRFFHDNALMGIQVIEAARRHAVGRFVC
ncbi:MAG: NAD-dependent epimerase/dehydratase family protein, partial [Proteobacteria bacterium]|nr:NAD-dependent epimerase/dehydratase family protein [Pseudomonadota bacterium]